MVFFNFLFYIYLIKSLVFNGLFLLATLPFCYVPICYAFSILLFSELLLKILQKYMIFILKFFISFIKILHPKNLIFLYVFWSFYYFQVIFTGILGFYIKFLISQLDIKKYKIKKYNLLLNLYYGYSAAHLFLI